MARQYMGIRVWSAPAAIALYGITGWLIAAERTRAVLVIQVVMNGANILLDLWFVLGLDLGVVGVAYATVIAEWSGLLIGLWFCRHAFGVAGWRDPARLFDKVRLWQMASLNRDILIRSLALQMIMISFLFYGARLGDLELAANQILLQFLQITAFALDGFAFAAEAIVGQAIGARAPQMLRKGAIYASIWCNVMAVILTLFFWICGPAVIDIMTTAPDVRAEARIYLIYMVFTPILGIAPWMLDGVFIGATKARDMRNMMLVSVAIYLAVLYALTPSLGNHGLWIALLISMVARGVTLAVKYPALEQAAAD
jgi:MATE family multidrug resistance protein